MMHNFTAGVELRLLQQTYVSSCQEKSVDDLTPLQSGCRQKNKKHWPTKRKIKNWSVITSLVSSSWVQYLFFTALFASLFSPSSMSIFTVSFAEVPRFTVWDVTVPWALGGAGGDIGLKLMVWPTKWKFSPCMCGCGGYCGRWRKFVKPPGG